MHKHLRTFYHMLQFARLFFHFCSQENGTCGDVLQDSVSRMRVSDEDRIRLFTYCAMVFGEGVKDIEAVHVYDGRIDAQLCPAVNISESRRIRTGLGQWTYT